MYSIANHGLNGRRIDRTDSDPEAESDGPLVAAESNVDPDITLVIPTKNEETGIGACIERAIDAFEELDARAEIIVSDSSTDGTQDVAREYGARVVTPDGTGYGYAYQYAFERARGDIVAMGDGDTTYDFGELPRLVSHLEDSGADMVIGSRLDGEIKPGAMPTLHRFVGNPVLTGFLNAFYDAGVSDAHSGMRVFHRDVLDRLEWNTDGMEFASEMIMAASAAGLDIEEVPITYHPREGDATIHTFRDGWRHLKFMLVNAPSHLFTAPATACVLGGIGLLLLSLFAPMFSYTVPEFHTAVGGSLLVLVGSQIAVLALLTTAVGDPIQPPSDPITNALRRGFTLERGLLVGGTLGTISAVGYVLRVSSLASQDILLLLGCVLGIQVVFNSFYVDLLLDESDVASPAQSESSTAIVYDESEAD